MLVWLYPLPQWRNEVRDVLGSLAAMAYKEVNHKPAVCKDNISPALIADLGVFGVWLP